MIKIITGRQTDPLQEKILEQAVENYKQNPEYETFIIVPNHIKFTTEIKAINKLANSQGKTETSVKNLQILSFSRLAWYFLKESSDKLETQLDDAAAAMLLSKIIEKRRAELKLFQNTNINSGLVSQLYDSILQVYNGNIELDEIKTDDLDNETKNKLHDLKIIYSDFREEIAGKFITKNETEMKLNEILASSEDLKNTSFYFTDFSHFSLQELLTIQLLTMKAKNVTLAFKTKIGEINPAAIPGDYDYVIQNTIKRLIDFLNKREIDFEHETFPLNSKQTERERLNSLWTDTISIKENLENVQLVKADSRYSEAYFVARTIYQQVALNDYRYQDFLILAPNLHEYETYLVPILRQNGIPFFNDLQQEMKYHPLVVLIENLAALLKRPWQSNNLLAILKTRLLIPEWYHDEASYSRDVDDLENFVLAHGINHTLWKKSFSNFISADVIRLDKLPDEIGRIDKLRQFLIEKIDKLFNDLKAETDSQKAVTTFFNFLTNNGVTQRLEKWRDKANEAGDLQLAQQPEQLWDLLITLLKDYLLINSEKFDLAEFFEMLINSFRQANFSQIPSTLDAVNISEIGMVQNTTYKQVFIIGASSGSLPSIQKTPGFLSSENLENMSASFKEDSYLEDRQLTNNLDQNYQFGLAMALAHDKLYISYPRLNAMNEELDPSTFYERLKQFRAPEMEQHDLPDKMQDVLSFITNPDASLGYLTYLNSITKNNSISELLNLTKNNIPEKFDSIEQANQFDNNPIDIGLDLAQKLYGQDLNSSVSQLETYYENSYEYFLNYGLRLRKRFENELDVIQAGNYFHETFDRLVKELNAKKLNLAEIDAIELEKLLEIARTEMKDDSKYAQLMNDPFNRYLFTCLDKTTSKVANNWRNMLNDTPLRAAYSELSFGSSEKIKGLKFDLPDLAGKHSVNLRGKIDRVDLAKVSSNQTLAQIIDYKSSAKKFDLGMFYNGISLQMISYLDVLSKNAKYFASDKLSLFGAFYQTITQKLDRLNGKELIGSDLNVKDNLLNGKQKLMYTGIISNDPKLLVEAEPLLQDSSMSSHVYAGVKTKKNGGFTLPRNSNFSEDELKMLLDFDELLIKEASNEILSGKITLNPYRYGKTKNALTYSDYRDIFFFDAMLRQNQYHDISSLSKKELLEKIKDKLNGEDK
ncbi:PD-(D/E)XK nuclease family protein [Lactobacillus agrestimuris]|uniref:PD-(D/E)XK nuclease family protein n=1 Tax=Lactobacillus agrestimuris TaxID=2941328 RepID=UPI0020434497|nr:PD-(D/E)XK nuclease family protein [Lactobacillus agrestimuris]